MWHRGGRAGFGCAALVLLIAGMELLSFGAGGSLVGPFTGPVQASGAGPAGSVAGLAMFAQAATSLERGGGPSAGVQGRCDATDSGEVVCRGPSGGLRTEEGSALQLDGTAPPQWFNVTANISSHSSGGLPSVYEFGRMAYDPLLSELVLFDGCTYTRLVCPETNQTWTYNGFGWTNLTRTLTIAPSPRILEGMDFDPALGGVVLFGGSKGTNASLPSLSDTWLFNSTGWTNITSTLGNPGDEPGGGAGWTGGAMAFDPALNALVVVDGCSDFLCTSVYDHTWLLNASGWSEAAGPGDPGPTTSLYGSSAAYDPVDSDLVLFGGYDAGEGATSNLTFLLNSSGTWLNVTADDAGCAGGICYTPPGRDGGAMTWDAQLQSIFLTGGYDSTSQISLNDSWLFSNGTWLPANATGVTAPAGYDAVAQPAMPEESPSAAPIVIGGAGSCSPGCATNEWVYEVPPELTLTENHSIDDAGTPMAFNATSRAGTGSGLVVAWNVSFGDLLSSTPARKATDVSPFALLQYNVTHSYAAPGTVYPTVSLADFYYVVGTSSSPPVTLNPVLAATITASAETIHVGDTVTFSLALTGGTPPYTYFWSFGNGNNSTVENPPTQLYSTVGFGKVTFTATDSVGRHGYDKVIITVLSKSSPGFSLQDLYPYGSVSYTHLTLPTILLV